MSYWFSVPPLDNAGEGAGGPLRDAGALLSRAAEGQPCVHFVGERYCKRINLRVLAALAATSERDFPPRDRGCSESTHL